MPSKHLLYESRGTVCGNCSVIAVWEDIYENQLRKVENAIYELAQNTSVGHDHGVKILSCHILCSLNFRTSLISDRRAGNKTKIIETTYFVLKMAN